MQDAGLQEAISLLGGTLCTETTPGVLLVTHGAKQTSSAVLPKAAAVATVAELLVSEGF